MEMDEKLDHGNIISQTKVTIDINDDVLKLTTKLTQAAEILLTDKLPEICAQNYTSLPQDESLATFTPSHKTISHNSALVPSVKTFNALKGVGAKAVHALIRSLNPEPGAWTIIPTRHSERPQGVEESHSTRHCEEHIDVAIYLINPLSFRA